MGLPPQIAYDYAQYEKRKEVKRMNRMNETNIRMIPVSEIWPHPDNPRKDLGDLEELTASVGAMGVMQNLTVVRGHGDVESGYTVIIGHRRLAASKAAGLREVPCAVVEMTAKEQVQTMLLENMQRADLTIPEQAYGFQMMMDLGATVEEISRDTGFAPRTIQRRLQIAGLPEEAVRDAQKTLELRIEDYVEVARIKDRKARERVLRSDSMQNFRWQLRSALEKEREAENLKQIKKELKERGIEEWKKSGNPQWDNRYERLAQIDMRTEKREALPKKVPEKAFWVWSEPWLYILCQKEKQKEVQKKSKKEIEADKMRQNLKRLAQDAYRSRYDYVVRFSACTRYAAVIDDMLTEALLKYVIEYTYVNWMKELKDIVPGFDTSGSRPKLNDLLTAINGEDCCRVRLLTAYSIMGDGGDKCPVNWNYGESKPEYHDSKYLTWIYEMLAKIGYMPSTDEQAMLDGTHEFYKRG